MTLNMESGDGFEMSNFLKPASAHNIERNALMFKVVICSKYNKSYLQTA